MWRGTITLNTAVLFCLGFLCMFLFGGITGVILAQPRAGLPAAQHLLRRRPLPLRDVRRLGVRRLRRHLLLVSEVHRHESCDERLGKLSFVVLFIGFNLTLLPPARPGPAGHAPADRDLRRQPGLELPQHAVEHRRLHRRASGCSSRWSTCSTPTAAARSPATTPGTARPSSGPARRRRPTTTSRPCRRSAPSARCGTPTIPTS